VLRYALFVMVLSLAACQGEKPAAAPLPRVSVAHPIARDVIDWDDYVGQFEAIQDVSVMPRVSGTIMEILFRNGQDVTAGEPLFIIDPRPYRAAYQQAVAATGRADALLENARAEMARAEKLVDSGATSKEEYDTKLAAVRTDEADVAARRAAQNAARASVMSLRPIRRCSRAS
jgi:RND family efflux transporter MFP subunit